MEHTIATPTLTQRHSSGPQLLVAVLFALCLLAIAALAPSDYDDVATGASAPVADVEPNFASAAF